MPGIRIRHRTLRSCLALVPIASAPTPIGDHGPVECPTCHVWHPVKTIHLWLDDTGSCTISQGVYDSMRTGWTGPPEYDVVGEVKNPPPLTIGVLREKQDQDSRTLIISRARIHPNTRPAHLR